MGWIKNKNKEKRSELNDAVTSLAASMYVLNQVEGSSIMQKMKADNARAKEERAARKAAKKFSKDA